MRRLRIKGVRLAILGSSIVSVILFQNCGGGFKIADELNLSSNSSSATPLVPVEDIPVDPTAGLSVYVRNTQVRQGSDIKFKVELNKAHTAPVVVQLKTKAGSALPAVDYYDSQFSVTIPAGQLTAEAVVRSNVTTLFTADKNMGLEATSVSAGSIAQKDGVALIQATQKVMSGVQNVSLGAGQNCALMANGAVRCWGTSVAGALGTKTEFAAGTIIDVPGVSAKQVSSGSNFSCALTPQNTVKCWGNNSGGSIGVPIGSETTLPPTDVPGLSDVVQLDSEDGNTCALKSNGTVICWGRQLYLPAGLRDYSIQGPMKKIGLNSGYNGSDSVCGITATNTVKCWLLTSTQPASDLPGITNVVQLTGGKARICALNNSGQVYCWSSSIDAQGKYAGNPTMVAGLSDVQQIAAGQDTYCAASTQKVYCWGQVGLSNSPTVVTPKEISGFTEVKKLSVSGNVCGVTNQNTLKCWGDNFNGQIGNSTVAVSSIPIAVSYLSQAKQFDVGPIHGCLVTAQGTVQCWGSGSYGQLGNGGTADASEPVTVPGLTGVQNVVVGDNHSCALTAQNTVKCWGRNTYGTLGDGTTKDSSVPVDVINLTGVKQLVSGRFHICALTNADEVKCWGYNYANTIPGIPVPATSTPAVIGNVAGAVKLVAGHFSTFAVMPNSTVRAWFYSSATASPISASAFKQVAGGGGHDCVITAQDTVQCRGDYNTAGQIGNNSTTPSAQYVTVAGLNNVLQISASDKHTCALSTDGQLNCWGSNLTRQCGSEKEMQYLTPHPVPPISGVKQVITSFTKTYLIMENGQVRAMGRLLSFADTALDVTEPVN